MSAAIFGLLGVLVGGLATYFSQRSHDLRLEDRQQQAADAANRRASIQAARLILTDLFAIIAAMRSSYESKAWLLRVKLRDQAWREERRHLSTTLTDQQWRDVSAAFINVAVWNDLTQGWLESDLVMRLIPRAKLSGKDDAGLAALRSSLIQTCGQAAEALRPIALPSLDDDDPLARLFLESLEHRSAGSTS